MSGEKILGRATIYIDGQFYDSQPGATIRPGGLRNNERPFTHDVKHSQTLIAAQVACSIPVIEGMSIRALQEMTGAEIHFKTDTGQTYIVKNAVQTAEVVVSDGDSGGVAPLTFSGPPAEEVM